MKMRSKISTRHALGILSYVDRNWPTVYYTLTLSVLLFNVLFLSGFSCRGKSDFGTFAITIWVSTKNMKEMA